MTNDNDRNTTAQAGDASRSQAYPRGPVTSADDPRVTAYALGELGGGSASELSPDGASELSAGAAGELSSGELSAAAQTDQTEARLAVETWLAAHPEARDELAALSELGNMLRDELAAEPAPALDVERRAALEQALNAGAGRPARRSQAWRPWISAAAVLLLALSVVLQQAGVFERAGGGGSGSDGLGSAYGDGRDADDASVARGDGYAAEASSLALGAGRDTGSMSSRAAISVDAPEAAQPQVGSIRLSESDVGFYAFSEQGLALIGAETETESESLDEAIRLFQADGSKLPRNAGYPRAEASEPQSDVAESALEAVRDTLSPGRAKGTPAAPSAAPAPEEGGVLMGGQGGGGGGTRIDSVSSSPGLRTGPGLLALGGKLRKRAAAPTRSHGQTEALRSLGYGAAERDADDRLDSGYRPVRSGESYADVRENPFVRITGDGHSALSTFGLDVDTASYSNVRRFLHRRQLPPPESVRLEELINAFSYDDPAPTDGDPLGVSVEAAECPWAPGHRLVRIGIKGREIPASQRPPSNLVLLLDVSGSMKSADKLPLLVQSMELLLGSLRDDDRMAIVTYASGTKLVLPSTPVSERDTIVSALRSLHADGSTHASAGIELAYKVATEAFFDEGNNRVLLATDGDFNVGITDHGGLHDLITSKAQGGIFLTVLGFGTGNLKDDTAELLANKGNGNYAYIDGLDEAHRVLVREVQGTLHTIAKDVKLQVEFNPATVQAWRQLGYENRALAATDFRDDKKDAGEVGAGHSLTALYEVIPVGLELPGGTADLRYQADGADGADGAGAAGAAGAESGAGGAGRVPHAALSELLNVNLRWMPASGGAARERAFPFEDPGRGFAEASTDLRFSAAVAAFGMTLRHSQHVGDIDLLAVADLADAAKGDDPDGRRAEFVTLARTARGLLQR